jgi:hypothetical protein
LITDHSRSKETNHGTKRTEASEEQQEGTCKELERKARRQASQEEQLVVQKKIW